MDHQIKNIETFFKVRAIALAFFGMFCTGVFAQKNADFSFMRQIGVEHFNGDMTTIKPMVIAIIDDGFLLSHQELESFIFKNKNEIPHNGIDDDKNGKVDDDIGWDVSDDDRDVSIAEGNEKIFYHGTYVAGIIVKVAKQFYGNKEAHKYVKILPIKAVSDNASQTYIKDGYKSIDYAMQQEVDVICMAWSGGNPNSEEMELLNKAANKQITLVASAGNFNNKEILYPANFASSIAVSAINQAFKKLDIANFGSRIDVSAPGQQIKGAHPIKANAYVTENGTSGATAIVASCVGIIKSIFPELTAVEIKNAVLNSSMDNQQIESKFHGNMGAGIIHLENALTYRRNFPKVQEFNVGQKSKGQLVFNNENQQEELVIKPKGGYNGFELLVNSNKKKLKGEIIFVNESGVEIKVDLNILPYKGYIDGGFVKTKITASVLRNKEFVSVTYKGETIDSSSVYCKDVQVLTNEKGILEDGSRDENYANNCSCKWKIEVPMGKQIKLDFKEVHTESAVDYIYIANGSTMLQENIIARVSGDKIPPTIYSSGNEILIWFVSNENKTKAGWKIAYETVE